jgi:hypothetical protein
MVVLLPINAPIIETIIDNTHPLQIKIQSEPFQKSSEKTVIIVNALHISGTYQKLLGFFLTTKKQQTIIDKLYMTMVIMDKASPLGLYSVKT